jgi:egghead protein (zeste-white 4 protein)
MLISLLVFSIINEMCDLLGFLAYRRTPPPPSSRSGAPGTLIVQFVSRGNNWEVLRHSARVARQLLTREFGYSFSIRLVTHKPVDHHFTEEERALFSWVIVPDDFTCKNGTMYKARALEFARLHEDANRDPEEKSWILFMDEESTLTVSAVRGVEQFILRDISRNQIGQGLITYTGGRFGNRALIAAADVNRVGWDLGRFFYQFGILNNVFFGFHGSYFVASTRVINKIGFDAGPVASMTEDIYFATQAACQGITFRWLAGFVREQSTETFPDFMRQRRRWVTGLMLFIFDKRFPLIHRLPMMSIMLSQRLTAITPIFLIVLATTAIMETHSIPFIWVILYYMAVLRPAFLIGILGTIEDRSDHSVGERISYIMKFLILAPIIPYLETTASLYAFLCPDREFYVVNKNMREIQTE